MKGIRVLGVGIRFVSRTGLAVCDKAIEFSKCVIATGGRPRPPSIPGLSQCKYYTSSDIFTISSLPERLVVIGTGPLGAELAQAFGLFGSHVVCVSNGFLKREDSQAAAIVKGNGRGDEAAVQHINKSTVYQLFFSKKKKA